MQDEGCSHLGRSDHHGGREGDGLAEGELDVPGAGREVNNEVVQLACGRRAVRIFRVWGFRVLGVLGIQCKTLKP